jgi:gas vesicle protein
MIDKSSSKLPFFIIAAGLGAIAGALSVLLARKESREYLRERGAKGLEYLGETGAKLRESGTGLMEKGRELMKGCCATAERTTDAEQADKPEIH